MEEIQVQKKPRGFAAIDPQRRREFGSRGGVTAHINKTAHVFSPETARLAGQKGGRTISQNKAWMREIGRRGGSRGKKTNPTTVIMTV